MGMRDSRRQGRKKGSDNIFHLVGIVFFQYDEHDSDPKSHFIIFRSSSLFFAFKKGAIG